MLCRTETYYHVIIQTEVLCIIRSISTASTTFNLVFLVSKDTVERECVNVRATTNTTCRTEIVIIQTEVPAYGVRSIIVTRKISVNISHVQQYTPPVLRFESVLLYVSYIQCMPVIMMLVSGCRVRQLHKGSCLLLLLAACIVRIFFVQQFSIYNNFMIPILSLSECPRLLLRNHRYFVVCHIQKQ